jgi:hypothetical protein
MLLCGAAYGGIYSFALSPAYCAHSRNYADVAPCYKYDVRGIGVDILLVGDSSLLYGIRPATVERASHQLTYNYGMVGPAFTFNPFAVIDHYLKTNRRPRAVVVYLSPWSRLELHKITDPQWFPVAVLTLRHGPWLDFFHLLRARPSALVEIPPTIVQSTGLFTGFMKQLRSAMERDGGWFDYGETLTGDHIALAGDCRRTDQSADVAFAADNRDAFTELRSHYSTLGLPVFFYIAPTAICDGHINEIRNVYAGVADNQPAALSNLFFANDTPSGGHSHVNSDGVGPVSELLADFLGRLQSGPTEKHRQ